MNTLFSALQAEFGSQYVFTTTEICRQVSRDALRPHRGFAAMTTLEQQPIAVIQPGSTEDVIRLVHYARQYRIPLVPYGGGSGLMGGALSVRPGVVVDMKRMNQVLHIDPQALSVRVQSGLRLRSLGEALAQHGLLLGHDPWSIGIATVGGAIGTNGLGYLGGRYGSMGQQVVGLEVVSGTGQVVRTPPLRKRSTGPDLTQFFIGAEGTLGIITEATLQIFPQPEKQVLLGFTVPDFPAGFHAVLEMQRRGLHPTSMDLAADDWPLDLQARRDFPPPQPPLLRLVFTGLTQAVEECAERAREVAYQYGATDLELAEVAEYWANRHAIADRWAQDPALREGQWLETPQGKSQFDFLHMTIPVAHLLDFRQQVFACVQQRGVSLCEEGIWIWPECYSLVLYCRQTRDNQAAEIMRHTTDEIYRLAQARGGAIEYVHGVGVRLSHLMERELGNGMTVLRALKAALDPDGIMNPGKLGLEQGL
jgi:alkyldihydroxyacetonephosphate synthase